MMVVHLCEKLGLLYCMSQLGTWVGGWVGVRPPPWGDTPNDPNPHFVREGERERERVGRDGKGTERSNREEREREWGAGERAGENGRERVGERPTEQESGANRRKGRVVGLS